MLTSLRLVALTVFFSVPCFAVQARGAGEPWASDTDPTDVPKSHVQEVTTSPFTYNITHGIAAGFLSYALIRVIQGRFREVHWLLWAVDVLFVIYFVRGLLA